jgi:hypothetical protein
MRITRVFGLKLHTCTKCFKSYFRIVELAKRCLTCNPTKTIACSLWRGRVKPKLIEAGTWLLRRLLQLKCLNAHHRLAT